MMDAMIRPEKFDAVGGAVVPVIGELFEDDEEHPGPPLVHGHGVDAPMPDGGADDPEDHGLGDEARKAMGRDDDKGGAALGPGIGPAPQAFVEPGLAEDEEHEDPVKWDSELRIDEQFHCPKAPGRRDRAGPRLG